MMRVFLVCKTTAETDQGHVFEVMGAFASEAEAVSQCHSGEWIGPLTMGERFPDEPMEWPGAYYPGDSTKRS